MIHWALDSLAHHPSLGHGEPTPGLLGPAEKQLLAGLKVPKRRQDWLIGRYALKGLLSEHLSGYHGMRIPLDDLEVRPASDGAPEVWLRGVRSDLQVSLSHSGGRAATALSPHPQVAVGIDLETVRPRSERFMRDYLTDSERSQVVEAPPGEKDLLVTLFWSAKEAVLKALRLGLTVSPKSVACELTTAKRDDDEWSPLVVSVSQPTLARAGVVGPNTMLSGFWQPLGGQVLTLATCTPRPRTTDFTDFTDHGPRTS